jgi:purine-binding chemotaxis protein CheW
MEATKELVTEGQYLTFFIGDEEYAADILRVREVIEYDTITRVPAMPDCIRGVINLRGSVVPVVDLAVKLGLGETPVTKWTCIIIVEVRFDNEKTAIGLMADAVSQVIDLRPEDVEPPPTFGTRIRADYLLGMGKAGKKFVLMLDINRVLSINELLDVASFSAAQPE